MRRNNTHKQMLLSIALILLSPLAHSWEISISRGASFDHDGNYYYESHKSGEKYRLQETRDNWGVCIDPPEKGSQWAIGLCYSRFRNSFGNSSNFYGFHGEFKTKDYRFVGQEETSFSFHHGLMLGLASGYQEDQAFHVFDEMRVFGYVTVGIGFNIPVEGDDRISIRWTRGIAPLAGSDGDFLNLYLTQLVFKF